MPKGKVTRVAYRTRVRHALAKLVAKRQLVITREEFDEQLKEDVSLKEMPDLGTQATRCVQASLLAESNEGTLKFIGNKQSRFEITKQGAKRLAAKPSESINIGDADMADEAAMPSAQAKVDGADTVLDATHAYDGPGILVPPANVKDLMNAYTALSSMRELVNPDASPTRMPASAMFQALSELASELRPTFSDTFVRHRTLQAESTAIEGYLTGGFADPRVLRTPEGAPQTSRNVALLLKMMHEAHAHLSRAQRIGRLLTQLSVGRIALFAQLNTLHDRVDQLQGELDFTASQGVSDYGSSTV